jgi:hypothetical protein
MKLEDTRVNIYLKKKMKKKERTHVSTGDGLRPMEKAIGKPGAMQVIRSGMVRISRICAEVIVESSR